MNFIGRVTDFVDEFYGQLQTHEFYGSCILTNFIDRDKQQPSDDTEELTTLSEPSP